MSAIEAVEINTQQQAQQKEAVRLSVVQSRIRHLQDLAVQAKAAAEAYRDALKATAEEAGIDADALRAFVNARIRDDGGVKQKQRAEQLSLLFDELG